MKSYTIREMTVGQSAEFSKTVTESDICAFAGITGDFNPAHVNEAYAVSTRFGGRIAHGLLSAGFVSAVLGTQLPGPGTVYLSQTLQFTAPVHIGDTITARVTVRELFPERNRLILDTICLNQLGVQVLTGEATVLAPK